MNISRHLPLCVVTLVAVGALGSSWYEYRALADLRSLGLTVDERSRLQKVAWDAEKRAQAAEARLAAVRDARSASAGGEDATAKSSATQALGDYASNFIAKLDDPEIRRLMNIQQLANINRRNADFYKTAKLTPTQLAEFQQLLLERQNTATDVLIAATQQGINPMQDPDEFNQMVKSAQAEVDAKIQTALGPDEYNQFQTFQQSQNQRGTVNQLQQDLSYTDAPLSDAQKTQMTQVIAQSNPEGGSAVNDTTVNLAQGVLSAPQIQALQNLQQQQQAGAKLRQLMKQSGIPSRGPGG